MSRIGAVGHRLYTGEVSYDFVGRKKVWYALSATIVLISIGAMLFRGLNFGIEFEGGGDFRVPSANCSVEDVRAAVEPLLESEPIVQTTRAVDNVEFIRLQTEALPSGAGVGIETALVEACQANPDDITSSVIGAIWGGDVSQSAIIALIVFLVLVTILIRVLFETKMALAALFALAHDLVITIGVYALVGFEVTPATIIGMLTILGYSLYDTIVVFDSLRENVRGLERSAKMTYSEAANLSVNQTLIRSINTSVIVLLPVGTILFVGAYALGAGTLKDLSLVLFIGIIASTFSSIFFATPLLADLKEREPGMKALAKKVHANRAKQERTDAAGPAAADSGSGTTTTAVLERPPTTTDGPAPARSARPARPTTRPGGRPGRPSKKRRGR